MKPRYVISALAVVVLLFTAVLMYGHADGPTNATRPEVLQRRTLPSDLPVFTIPSDPNANAGSYYEEAIRMYGEHPGVLTRTAEHDALVDGLAAQLLQAADAGQVDAGFMDEHLPIALGAEPDYGQAIEDIYAWAIERSAYLFTHGEPKQARDLALAVWVFGQRMFERNVRLYHRNTGLDMMESAGGLLFEMSANDPTLDSQALRAWATAIGEIRQAWQPKLEIVMGVAPHPGDLVNIALHDEDPMFRFEATLRLGIHRYTASRGNRRAMNAAIRAAMASDHPMLAEAGRQADAVTLEQMRRLY